MPGRRLASRITLPRGAPYRRDHPAPSPVYGRAPARVVSAMPLQDGRAMVRQMRHEGLRLIPSGAVPVALVTPRPQAGRPQPAGAGAGGEARPAFVPEFGHTLSGAVVGDGGCARSGAPRRHRPRRAVSARAARKLRGERKNERSRGTAAWCAVAATVDRFLRLPVWEACVERAADGRAQESARPKGLAR